MVTGVDRTQREIRHCDPRRGGSQLDWAVGSVSGRDEDKFNCYGIPVIHGPELGLPVIEEKCLAWMECRLLPVTSAAEKYDTLFGEVVSAAADERAFVSGRWQFDGDKLNTLHHLGPGRL